MSAVAVQASAASPGQARGYVLRWLGLICILSIAVMRCVTVFAPHALFDTDPATDVIPLGGLAQAGSLWLDALLILACGIALLGEAIAGKRLSIIACVFALLPLPVVFWHGSHNALDLWRGSTWAAAAAACVTIAHLSRDARMRIVIASVLLAVMAPLVVRGVAQLTWEHAETVKAYEATKDEFLRQRGWSAESSATKIYERRLLQPQPIGWFTTSNIFGSVMIFGLIGSLGLMIGAARARMESGWTAAMGLCIAAAATLLSYTGSKGAMLAALIGTILALSPLVVPRVAGVISSRFGGLIIMALVVLTLIAVMARGTLLSETFAGEKSLLFRWHYTVASARIAAEHPLIGVGPDGFQDAYTLHRVPRNPEEVQSAHSMFWDWIATLGIPAGAAWIALVFFMLYRTVLPLRIESQANSSATPNDRTIMLSVIAITALGLVPAFFVESSTLDPRSILMRAVGIGAFAAFAILATRLMARTDGRVTRWCFAAAAVAVVIHGQIEMSFHQAGSVVWAMCALGLAGTISMKHAKRSAAGVLVALVMCSAAGWIAIEGAIPAMHRESIMNQDAKLLRAKVLDAKGLINSRRTVAQRLTESGENTRSPDPFLVEAAARQLELAAAATADPTAKVELLAAASNALAAPNLAGRSSAQHLRFGLLWQIADITERESDWRMADDLAMTLTLLDPHGLTAWRQRGDVLWAAGRHVEAAAAYQRALECDRNFSLDPLKQLNDRDRAIINSRINESRPMP